MSKEFHDITYLHQVFIVDGFKTSKTLPPALEYHRKVAKDLYPNAVYKLWGGDDLRVFLRKNFPADVLEAFDKLKPYSYKCDLARYCLMYVYGGIYFDLAIQMTHEWRIPLHYGVAAFTESYEGMDCWACIQTSLLWSLPQRREWYFAIRQIVDNCQNHFYGPHDHYPTAGALLGRSFAAAMSEKGQSFDADDQFVGEVRYITPDKANQNVTYVSPSFHVIGMRNKMKAGDISALGVKGSNNYCQIWKSKQVYHEDKSIWLASDKNIIADSSGYKNNGCIYINNKKGRVSYGPYVDFKKGSYKLTINFTEKTKYKNLFLDIAKEGGHAIKEFNYSYDKIETRTEETFFFVLDQDEKSLEFRPSVYGDFLGGIHSFTVEESDTFSWTVLHPTIVKDEVAFKKQNILEVKKDSKGRIFYGPFVDLKPGLYDLEIIFTEKTVYKNLVCKITSDYAKKDLENISKSYGVEKVRPKEDFRFVINDYERFVEFSLYVLGDFHGGVKEIKLSRNENSNKKSFLNSLARAYQKKKLSLDVKYIKNLLNKYFHVITRR